MLDSVMAPLELFRSVIREKMRSRTSCGFSFALPLSGPDTSRVAITASPAEVRAPASARGTVLVVDDDPSIRETLTDVLEEEGYHILCAENGKTALELLERAEPNLVLLDLMMPVMSGWEVLETVGERDDLSHIPIVVISAMLAPGARMCLPKPVDLGHLLQVVEHYCGILRT
jgi:CheY-like chemotaxis protein